MAKVDQKMVQRIHEEHQRMKLEMLKIRKLLEESVPEADFPEWRLNLLWLLRDFDNDLQKHFDLEEEGGFMRDIIAVAPQHAHGVRELEKDHKRLTGKLKAILEGVKKVKTGGDLQEAGIIAQVGDLFDQLAAHEEAEGEMMISTYWQDDGAGD